MNEYGRIHFVLFYICFLLFYRWFRLGKNANTGTEEWQFTGTYWKREWSHCPDIFWPSRELELFRITIILCEVSKNILCTIEFLKTTHFFLRCCGFYIGSTSKRVTRRSNMICTESSELRRVGGVKVIVDSFKPRPPLASMCSPVDCFFFRCAKYYKLSGWALARNSIDYVKSAYLLDYSQTSAEFRAVKSMWSAQ